MSPDREKRHSTVEFTQQRLSEYYRSAELELPPRFTKREFGFFYYAGKGMQRPVAFKTRDEVKEFLWRRTPAHVYFSSAYYEKPEVPMAEKKWLGADLVFDLDADHIAGADRMTYPEMLEKVKEEFIKLIEDFLVRDFGFREDQMDVVFSGGRGYHLHIRAQEVLGLDSGERRSIVDYITGNNIDWELVSFDSLKAGAGGWMGKLARGLIDGLEAMGRMERKKAIREISRFPGVGKTTAGRLYDKLDGIIMRLKDLDEEGKLEFLKDRYPDLETEGLRDLIETHDILGGDILSGKKEQMAFFEHIAKGMVIPLQKGETDEPVTSDVKRLIRMPTSIHGKSSFRVTPMSLGELEGFDPLKHAIAFPDDPVGVEGTANAEIPLRGDLYRVKKGERVELPTFAAMFMFCRGQAVLGRPG